MKQTKIKKESLSIGAKYNLGPFKEQYVLCSVGPDRHVAAICLNERLPNRWNNPVQVKDMYNISKKELRQIIGGGCSH